MSRYFILNEIKLEDKIVPCATVMLNARITENFKI